VIGGMPGSGTRVFASILRLAGGHIGAELSKALDARGFLGFANRWVDEYVESWATGTPAAARAQMSEDLRAFLDRHATPADREGLWGWKAPRSICFLPLLYDELAAMRFVHVLRDGRDVAMKLRGSLPKLSGNVNPRLSMGQSTLLDRATLEAPISVGAIAVWARVNELAADHGEREGEAYLRVRLEDLCEHPRDVAHELLRFMLDREPSAELIGAAAAEVERPATLGRWRDADPEELERITAAGEPALERFGYTS
jgi:hypothetical protein